MAQLYRAGLVVLVVLSVGDLAAPLLTDGETPPMFIALIGAGLGLVSLVLIALAWRGRVAAAVGAVVIRLLSALTAVPAFLVDGVPTVPKVLASRGRQGQALVLPAYDHVLKASHLFNIMDARGAIAVAERQSYIGRIRDLCKRCAEAWVAQQEAVS